MIEHRKKLLDVKKKTSNELKSKNDLKIITTGLALLVSLNKRYYSSN